MRCPFGQGDVVGREELAAACDRASLSSGSVTISLGCVDLGPATVRALDVENLDLDDRRARGHGVWVRWRARPRPVRGRLHAPTAPRNVRVNARVTSLEHRRAAKVLPMPAGLQSQSPHWRLLHSRYSAAAGRFLCPIYSTHAMTASQNRLTRVWVMQHSRLLERFVVMCSSLEYGAQTSSKESTSSR